jgi:hypothetical protein
LVKVLSVSTRTCAAGVALRLAAFLNDGHGQKADGDLFAGRGDHVQLAGVGRWHDFLGQADQAVGLAGHG